MDRIDLQLLLDLRPACLGLDRAIADGRQRTVPEALAGILLHGAQDVLGVLLRLILVEQRHDLTDHVAHRIVAQILGDRDEPDIGLGKLADVELKLELVAEEAAERVDQNHVERRAAMQRGVHHALELGAPIVGRRLSGFDILGHDLPALGFAMTFGLTALIRDREVVFGLPVRGDAQIECGARGGATRRSLRWVRGCVGHGMILELGKRSEQLVQDVAKIGFDDADFGLGDGHHLRPVVRDMDALLRALTLARVP